MKTGGIAVTDSDGPLDESLGLELFGPRRADGGRPVHYNWLVRNPPYELRGIAPGDYTLRVRREDMTHVEMPVTITAGAITKVEL